jgi:hypothetical protein
MPFMLTSSLGLEPDAFNRRLRIRRPHLPRWLDWVRVRRLSIGGAQLDLRFERSGDSTLVAVTRRRGDVLVSVEA